MTDLPDTAATQAGLLVGSRTATLVLALRANDGSAATPPPFVPGNQPGDYQLTPPNFAQPVFTNWGSVTPWVLDAGSQFRAPPPPPLSSPEWAAAINEVQSLGQDTSTTRTADQTTIAKFWAPPIWNTWNAIADSQVIAHAHQPGSRPRTCSPISTSAWPTAPSPSTTPSTTTSCGDR